MSARQSLVDRWSEAPWWDYAFSTALVAIHLTTVQALHWGDWLSWLESSQRITVYGTAASIVSAIGGLSAIAISIYSTAGGARARSIRQHYPIELRRNFKGLLVGIAIACGLFLLAQALDIKSDPRFARFIFEFGTLLAIFRFIRLIWLFGAMMEVSDNDLADNSLTPAPAIDPSWLRARSTNPEHSQDDESAAIS
ncbi:hypothetical protein ACIPYS_01195 [Kitasatospora sp. NPDC089913]|uniref:hypothetical protein n=1 Tax=Kitasatospora sp. NPDC089913 TaxID=3364080 RepID=UPI0038258AA3